MGKLGSCWVAQFKYPVAVCVAVKVQLFTQRSIILLSQPYPQFPMMDQQNFLSKILKAVLYEVKVLNMKSYITFKLLAHKQVFPHHLISFISAQNWLALLHLQSSIHVSDTLYLLISSPFATPEALLQSQHTPFLAYPLTTVINLQHFKNHEGTSLSS